MALDQSVCTELLEAFKTSDGVDLIRDAVRYVFQELIESEATGVIGAGPYERTEGRVTERNGHRVRLVSTKAGDVELAIPKLRKGSFFPSILEPRRRIDQALYAVVMEAYVGGISTRSVDELVAALGIGSGIKKSEVSRICAGLDEVVGAFRTRRLDHQEFPYVFLDATYLHVRDNHHVTSKAVVIATGVRADGHREILGLDVGDSEDEVFWRGFLRSLRTRGLAGVKLVISDQHAGLVNAIGRCFQGAAHQRCRVHFARNLLASVPIRPGSAGATRTGTASSVSSCPRAPTYRSTPKRTSTPSPPCSTSVHARPSHGRLQRNDSTDLSRPLLESARLNISGRPPWGLPIRRPGDIGANPGLGGHPSQGVNARGPRGSGWPCQGAQNGILRAVQARRSRVGDGARSATASRWGNAPKASKEPWGMARC